MARQHLSLGLLSDRQHRLAALCLAPLAVGPEDRPAWTALAELSALLPCWMAADDLAGLSLAQQEALKAAGCQVAAVGSIGVLAAPGNPALPASAKYLAGDWYMQPLAKPVSNQTGSRALALKLAQLIATDADTWEIEDIFRREPTLSYNLLRLVNSPGIGNGRRIDSLAQAILMLGRRQLRRWLNLILFSTQKDDPRAAMLLARVAVRARTLELLTKEAGDDKEEQERAFMVGMFSLLGVMFSTPLAEVLQPLNLDADMTAALISRSGRLGAFLAAVEAFERGASAQADGLLEGLLPAAVDMDGLLIAAHVWMLGLIKEAAHG